MYASRIRVSVGFLAQRWELRRSALGGASSGELRVTTDIWRINATWSQLRGTRSTSSDWKYPSRRAIHLLSLVTLDKNEQKSK